MLLLKICLLIRRHGINRIIIIIIIMEVVVVLLLLP